jgi:hypothetical protein
VRAAALLLTLACGGAACGPTEDPVPPPVTPATPAIVLTTPSDLRASVPALAGWQRGDINAQELPAPSRSSTATVTFLRGAEKLDLEIADTGGDAKSIESLEHMAGSTTSRTVGNGYFKGTMIAGFPAVESWNTVDRIGEVTVLIRRRYIIHVAGSGLTDAAPMRALAEAVDTSRLK